MPENYFIPPWARCPHCGVTMTPGGAPIQDYFRGGSAVCYACSQPVDWWSIVLDTLRRGQLSSQLLAPLGAYSTSFSFTLQPDQYVLIDLAVHGIPTDAIILDVSYRAGGGGLQPIEVRRFTDKHPFSVELYALPRVRDPQETRADIFIEWVPSSEDDITWKALTNAFRAYIHQEYQDVIIPANVAVELKLNRLLTTFLQDIVSTKRTKDFLESAATYSYQLNVVLPVITSLKDVPALADDIRGGLNTLRDFRNAMAHSGHPRQPLDKDVVSKCLCSALFGFHYLNVVASLILPK